MTFKVKEMYDVFKTSFPSEIYCDKLSTALNLAVIG